jgi:hypothetical protein
MIENIYYIYAKRPSESTWSAWSQSQTVERALYHCEKIRQAGFLAKVCDIVHKKAMVKDG